MNKKFNEFEVCVEEVQFDENTLMKEGRDNAMARLLSGLVTPCEHEKPGVFEFGFWPNRAVRNHCWFVRTGRDLRVTSELLDNVPDHVHVIGVRVHCFEGVLQPGSPMFGFGRESA